ncbi:MAG: hypothetical protein NUV67_05515 [archaeon]|nr:hypothetical protein [archaeon]
MRTRKMQGYSYKSRGKGAPVVRFTSKGLEGAAKSPSGIAKEFGLPEKNAHAFLSKLQRRVESMAKQSARGEKATDSFVELGVPNPNSKFSEHSLLFRVRHDPRNPEVFTLRQAGVGHTILAIRDERDPHGKLDPYERLKLILESGFRRTDFPNASRSGSYDSIHAKSNLKGRQGDSYVLWFLSPYESSIAYKNDYAGLPSSPPRQVSKITIRLAANLVEEQIRARIKEYKMELAKFGKPIEFVASKKRVAYAKDGEQIRLL